MYTQPERITLTYQGATFNRSLISLAIAVVSLLCFVFLKFKPEIPLPGAVAGPPLRKLALGMIIAFALISSISDALFVLDYKYFQKQVDCDKNNLYVIRKSGETVIPFSSISSVRLSNWGSKGVRGSSYIYIVGYQATDGRPKELDITLFLKMGKNFDLFEQWVQAKNPSAEIKNWSASIDPIVRLFRKKKDNGTH
jgi:hypothetical protein